MPHPHSQPSRSVVPHRCPQRAASPRRRRPRRRAPFARLLLLLAAMFAAAPGVRAQEEPAALETWYASTVSHTDGGDFVVTHFWSKGDRMRALTVLFGRPLVTIVNGPLYYTIDASRGTGIAIERSPLAMERDAQRGRPFGDEREVVLRSGGELVGEEEIGGQKTLLYRLTNDAGRAQVWVTPRAGLPVRVERYIRGTGKRERIDYVNWLSGIEIADSFFEPDASVQIEKLSYADYVRRAMTERLGPAPPLYAHLLHGEPR